MLFIYLFIAAYLTIRIKFIPIICPDPTLCTPTKRHVIATTVPAEN